MAPRPYWKGYLKLSLVSCPIALYPAIDASERVSFRQVNKKTGNRLRQQLVDFVTGEVVEAEDKGRGYEVGENQFLVVEEEELEKARTRPYSAAPTAQEEAPPIARRGAPKVEAKRSRPEPKILAPPRPRIENTRTIEIERFVPRGQIDARYHHTPYYIGPRDLVGQEAFAVIRYALSAKRAVGMGRVVLSNRERPIMLEPMGLGLRGITLRYTHQIRSEAEYFGDIPEMSLPKEMLRIAEHIVGIETLQFHLVDAQREERYDAASRKTCGAFAEERDRLDGNTQEEPAGRAAGPQAPMSTTREICACLPTIGPLIRCWAAGQWLKTTVQAQRRCTWSMHRPEPQSADFQETSFGATAGVGPGSTQLIPRKLHLPTTRRTVSPVTSRRDSQTGSTLTAIRS